MQTTTELLDCYYVGPLREIVQAAGFKLTADSGRNLLKRELIELVERELYTKAHVRGVYDSLGEVERTIVDFLTASLQSVAVTRLERWLAQRNLIPSEAPEHSQPPDARQKQRSASPLDPALRRLMLLGLVFSEPKTNYAGTHFKQGMTPGENVFIPDVVRSLLPAPPPITAEFNDWQPTRVVEGAPQQFVRNLFLYWTYVQRKSPPLLKSGAVGKRTLKQLDELLLLAPTNWDDVRREDQVPALLLLRNTLQSQGLVESRDGRLVATTTLTFWRRPLSEQIKIALEVWRILPDDVSAYETGRLMPLVGKGRRRLCERLAALPPGEWADITRLVERLQQTDVDFLFQNRSLLRRTTYGSYEMGGYYLGSGDDYVRRLDSLELTFVRDALSEFLLLLGIVSVAKDDAQKEAIRVTPFGHAVLNGQAIEQVEPTGEVIVQPTFQILALGAVDYEVLAHIGQFAELRNADRNVVEYQLTHDSAYAAMQDGWTADKIAELLETQSGKALSQNVRRTLNEWAAGHERIVFRPNLLLLQSVTPLPLDQPPFRGVVVERVTDSIAILKPSKRKRLISALLRAGILPAVDRAGSLDNSVQITADGSIELVGAAPDLYLLGRLHRVAEQTADGWRITREAVQRHSGDRESIDRYLELLDGIQRGPLPVELVERIRRWGRYYGSAELNTVTLIVFQDEKTRRLLCQDAQVGRFLTRIAGDARQAVVSNEQVNRVKARLAELGVAVVDRRE